MQNYSLATICQYFLETTFAAITTVSLFGGMSLTDLYIFRQAQRQTHWIETISSLATNSELDLGMNFDWTILTSLIWFDLYHPILVLVVCWVCHVWKWTSAPLWRLLQTATEFLRVFLSIYLPIISGHFDCPYWRKASSLHDAVTSVSLWRWCFPRILCVSTWRVANFEWDKWFSFNSEFFVTLP